MNKSTFEKVREKLYKKLVQTNLKQRTILLVLSVLIINFLVSFIPLRLDLSKNRAYSLSPATKKVVSGIIKPITITAYMSSDIPPRLIPLRRDVLDFLYEYESVVSGSIKIVVKDPKVDPKAESDAIKDGVPRLQFSEVEKDQYKVSSSFFGLTISNGLTTTAIPQTVTTTTLEYDITSTIYKMNRTVVQKIALVNFPVPYDPREDAFASLKRSLDKQFEFSEVQLSTSTATLDPKITKAALLVIDGSTQSTAFEETLLSNYIENGGSLVMFIDGVAVSDGLDVTPAQHTLFRFLNEYGIILHKNLALSNSSQTATFATGLGAFALKYPLWVSTNDFNKNSSDFSNITQLVFPWASSLSVLSNINIQVLASSLKNSWTQENKFVVIPNAIPSPLRNQLGSYPLIVESKISQGGSLLVVPTARFVREQYLGQTGGNIEFVVNVLNRYVSSGALSGVRSRSSIANPLKPINVTQKEIIKYVLLLGFPSLLTLFGIMRLYRRGKKSSV